MKTPRILLAFAILFGALAGAGLIHLFMLRFQSGEFFPVYSSLRADPLGAKALYASLESCPGITVERNYTSLQHWKLPPDATVLILATTLDNTEYIPRTIADKLDTFVRNGGRLVLTLRPRNIMAQLTEDWKNDEDPFGGDDADEDPTDESPEIKRPDTAPDKTPPADDPVPSDTGIIPDKDPATPEAETHTESRAETKTPTRNGRVRKDRTPARSSPRRSPLIRLHPEDDPKLICITEWLGLATSSGRMSNEVHAVLTPEFAGSGLPPAISCHTSLSFTNAVAATNLAVAVVEPWQTLYTRDEQAVVVERRMGAGSQALSTLTYFVSNEAMKDERHPTLLAWMIGPHSRIIFDEAHLGVQESRGVARLARRYGLHGFVLGLLLLVILFVWRNSTSLVPAGASTRDEAGPVTGGRHSEAGLANLLRRSITPANILQVCVSEWTRGRTRPSARLAAKTGQLRAIADTWTHISKHPDPVADAYNRMCQALKDKQ